MSSGNPDTDSDDVFDHGKKVKKEMELKPIIGSNSTEQSDSNQPTVLNDSTIFTDTHQTTIDPDNSMMNTASTSQSTVSCRGGESSKRRLDDSSSIVGSVVSIGDSNDGDNMPPPKVASVQTASEVEEYGLPSININSMVGHEVDDEYDDEYDEHDELDEYDEEDDEEDDYNFELLNRTMNVKVFWEKKHIQEFPIRMFQSIESIYERIAQLKCIETRQVNLKLHNKTLSPTDTPHSINYKVTDYIVGDAVFYKSPFGKPETQKLEEKEKEEEATFKINQMDVNHRLFISIKKSEKMYILYLKVAEKLGLNVKSFRIDFDGVKIKKSDTLESLDLEGDECFDLYQIKKKKRKNYYSF